MQRVVKDEEGIETGVMGTVELLNSRNFSTQPINSFDWSNDKVPPSTTLQTTQRQTDGVCSQLPFKCYLPEVA